MGPESKCVKGQGSESGIGHAGSGSGPRAGSPGFPVGGGCHQAPGHHHSSTEHKEGNSEVQVVDTAQDGWPRVRVTARWGRVQEFQDQPGGAQCQPHHEAPEGPLGKRRQGQWVVRGRPSPPQSQPAHRQQGKAWARRSSSAGRGPRPAPMSWLPQLSPSPTHLLVGTPPEDSQNEDCGHGGCQGAGD